MLTLDPSHELAFVQTDESITLTADTALIEAAREQARSEDSSLTEQFRLWLEQYAVRRQAARALQLMERMATCVASDGPLPDRERRTPTSWSTPARSRRGAAGC